MKRRGSSIIVVSLAMVVSILTVGLVVSLGVRQGTFDQGVDACVHTIAMRDPKRDAATNFGQGEKRFFFEVQSEWDLLKGVAPGVLPKLSPAGQVMEACWIKVRDLREPFSAFQRFMQVGRRSNPYVIDPIYSPRTACGKANEAYIRAYNAEMARLSPDSIARYCER